MSVTAYKSDGMFFFTVRLLVKPIKKILNIWYLCNAHVVLHVAVIFFRQKCQLLWGKTQTYFRKTNV